VIVRLASALALLVAAPVAAAGPSLEDYRHFRSLSLDLNGRVPTRAEVAAFETPGFDLQGWVDAHLGGSAYVERLTRVYMDALRLEVGPSFQFVPGTSTLRRVQVNGPDGNPLNIYFRLGQRRARVETDGELCLDQAETGLQFPHFAAPTGTPTNVSQATLDQFTTLVYPWWLYSDYASATPADRYGPAWATEHPGFQPDDVLLTEGDGGVQTTQIRVCNEEAQAAPMGTIYASGRTSNPPGPPLYGRLTQPPVDSFYATHHHGEPVDCTVGSGFSMSIDCGCGPGLSRCLPGGSFSFDPAAFAFSSQQPLGMDNPVDANQQSASSWTRVWWGEEVRHFLGYLFDQDRDFREVLTAHYSFVNGPLAQFYRSIAPNTCCGVALGLANLKQPDPLFDPAQLPADLQPQDQSKWELVQDRGPHASGILTMPAFVTKFGSRRSKGHVLYNAFLCRDFVAGNVQLQPSTEPNLMIRPGCQTCHVRLEPMAAYFSRIVESDWTWLPEDKFPIQNTICKNQPDGGLPKNGGCVTYYDPAFGDADAGMLRGAYGSPDHAALGPAGMAQEIIADDQFAGCVAQNVASSFLGRPLTVEDAVLKQSLADAFVQGGYKMRALVKAMVLSNVYARSNNLKSTPASDGGTP
jgi:hypothetical protein